MRSLKVDFARPQPVVLADRSVAGWVVLGMGGIFLVASLVGYRILFLETKTVQARIETLRRPQAGAARPILGSSEVVANEIKAVNRAIGRLSVPWGDMFRAVEEAKIDGIIVLSLKPNLQRGEIRIVGEADDFRMITAFVGELTSPGRLYRARLATHELRAGGQVYFDVVGEWPGVQ